MRNFVQMANYLTKLEQMATAQTDPMYVFTNEAVALIWGKFMR